MSVHGAMVRGGGRWRGKGGGGRAKGTVLPTRESGRWQWVWCGAAPPGKRRFSGGVAGVVLVGAHAQRMGEGGGRQST